MQTPSVNRKQFSPLLRISLNQIRIIFRTYARLNQPFYIGTGAKLQSASLLGTCHRGCCVTLAHKPCIICFREDDLNYTSTNIQRHEVLIFQNFTFNEPRSALYHSLMVTFYAKGRIFPKNYAQFLTVSDHVTLTKDTALLPP